MKTLSTSRLWSAAIALLMLLGTSLSHAATFTVSNTNDTNAGSLRQAITDALAGGAGPHDIQAGGVTGTISLQSALPTITNTNIRIHGPTSGTLTVTRGAGTFRLFTVSNAGGAATLTLNGLTLTNGIGTADLSVSADGGGILVLGATLNLNYCTISGCSTGSPGNGGAIAFTGSVTSTVTLNFCNITNNTGFTGGGIGSTLQGGSSTLTINNSLIAGNISNGATGGSGGGIQSTFIAATLRNTTISGNQAQVSNGGGIVSGSTSSLTCINCTVTNNRCVTGSLGGGIRSLSTTPVSLINTLFVGNFNGLTGSTAEDTSWGANTNKSAKNSVVGVDSGIGFATNTASQIGTSGAPKVVNLGALASNGGVTQTHQLNATVPELAINLGSNSDVTTIPSDQRGTGYDRVMGGTVDIGAFESGAVAPTFTGVSPLGAPAFVHGAGSLTLGNFTVPPGNNRLLVVVASDTHSLDITNVSFGGTTMTQSVERNDGFAVDSIWVLPLGTATTATTGNITVTRSGTGDFTFIGAQVFQNVHQTTPVSATDSAEPATNSTTVSRTIASATGDLVFDVLDSYRAGSLPTLAPTASNGQAVVHSAGSAIGVGYDSYKTSLKPGATSVNMSWTTSSEETLYLAVNLKQAAGAPAPEIAVTETGAGNIPDGGGPIGYGTTTVGTPVTKTFTVTNSGTATLNLSALSVPSGFTIAQNFASSTVAASGGTTTFQITMSAGAAATPSGTLQFTNDDADENPYNFTISGTVNSPLPTVTVVNPRNGSTAGGTSVTITGTSFTGATQVKFGSSAATNVTVVSDTSITATSPAGSGTVDVTVTTGAGTSATSAADQFTYQVSNQQPVYVSADGYIGETFFTIFFDVPLDAAHPPLISAFQVQVNGTDAAISSVTVDSAGKSVKLTLASTTLLPGDIIDFTYTDPTAGNDVNAIQDLSGTDAASFLHTLIVAIARPGPTVSSVSPNSGPAGGGTSVTITGSNFTGATGVKFGTNSATNVTVVSDTSITATSPAGTGTVDVTVTNSQNQTSATSAADRFTYTSLPAGTVIWPTSSGGNGHGYYLTSESSSLTWTQARDLAVSMGGHLVTITSAGEQAFLESSVINPAEQFWIGLTDAAVEGTFAWVTGEAFSYNHWEPGQPDNGGGVQDEDYGYLVSSAAPSGQAGNWADTVNNDGGVFRGIIEFDLAAAPVPTVTGINPTSGTTSGGQPVVISGTNFTGATAVTFGGTAAASFTVVNGTTINAVTPPGAAGLASVVVTTPDGSNSVPIFYTYVAPPAPEIAVSFNGNDIADGSNTTNPTLGTDFGSTPVAGGVVEHTFTITNTGTANLVLSGGPNFVTAGNPAYSVTQQPSGTIAPAGTTTFKVTFDPSALGSAVGSVSFGNNDSNENPFNFGIIGVGTGPQTFDLAGNPVSNTPFDTGDTYIYSVGPPPPLPVAGPSGNDVVTGAAATDGTGATDGTLFDGLQRSGFLAENGTLAFLGYLKIGTGGVDLTNYMGYWKSSGSSLTRVARQGFDAPETGATAAKFNILPLIPGINDDGQVTLFASLLQSGLSSPVTTAANDTGIWSELGGTGFQILIREDDTIPGLGGPKVDTLGYGCFATTKTSATTGEAAFVVGMKGSSTDTALLRTSVVNSDTTAVGVIARENTAAPGGGGENFNAMLPGFSGSVRMDATGNVVFASWLKPSNKFGIWYQDQATKTVSKTVLAGETAPGTTATFQSIDLPNMGGNGTYAFRAVLNSDGDNSTNAKNDGIWKGTGTAAPTLILRRGDDNTARPGLFSSAYTTTYPNIKAGNLYNGWLTNANHGAWLGWVDLGGDGISAFPYDGNFTATTDTFGIYTDTSGTMTLLAASGDAAPGIAGAKFFFIDHPVCGGAEQVAFIATVNGGGVSAGINDKGVWRTNAQGGAPVLVLRTGDSMTVDINGTPTSKTIGNVDIPGSGYAEHIWETPVMDATGKLLIFVTFTDGSTTQVLVP